MSLRDSERVFYFDDKALQRYEEAARRRLEYVIIDQLEQGRDANLGQAQLSWLPDDIAKVDYLVLEGVLAPIIQVRVSYQEREGGGTIEEEEREYEPYLWIGIAPVDSRLSGAQSADENPNCPWWGFPVAGRLYGLEPGASTFPQTVEALPGFLYAGGFDWLNRALAAYGAASGADFDHRVPIGSGFTEEVDQFLIEQGNFGPRPLIGPSFGVNVLSSQSGMILTEAAATRITAPPQAFTGIDDPDYWQSSIIVDPRGHVIPAGVHQARWVVIRGDSNHGITYTIEVPEDVEIPCTVERGWYEFSAWAQSFICECAEAGLHVRMVLGRGEMGTRIIRDAATRAELERIPTVGARVEVVDFFPSGIGATGDTAGTFFREEVLGGLPPCSEPRNDNAFGGNRGERGYWGQGLQVDILNGSWRLRPATRQSPFFGDDCPPSIHGDPESCIGCAGNDVTDSAGIHFSFPRGRCHTLIDSLGTHSLDMIGGIQFHFARVWQVQSDGRICYVKLAGNDGGAGSCTCQPWQYGRVLQAKGINEAGEEIGGWVVGQLVLVVGVSPPCSTCVLTSRTSVLVGTTTFQGVDYTTFFWSQLRCGESRHVQRFFDRVKHDMAENRVACIFEDGQVVDMTPSPVNIEVECNGVLTVFEV